MQKPKVKNVALVAVIAASGQSAKTIATRANLCAGCLSEIINCRVRPKPSTRRAIARALGVSQRSIFAVGSGA